MRGLRAAAKFLLGTSALAMAGALVGVVGLVILQAVPWSPPPPDRAAHYNWEGVSTNGPE